MRNVRELDIIYCCLTTPSIYGQHKEILHTTPSMDNTGRPGASLDEGGKARGVSHL